MICVRVIGMQLRYMLRFGACRGQEVALARQYSSIDEFLDYLITICKD
jgi:hypothetical protein